MPDNGIEIDYGAGDIEGLATVRFVPGEPVPDFLIGGAVLTVAGDNNQKYWKIIPLEDIVNHDFRSEDKFIPGNTREMLELELRRRFPGPRPGMSRVHSVGPRSRKHYMKGEWVKECIEGWRVTAKPLLGKVTTFEQLTSISQDVGSVLMSRGAFDALGSERNYESAGFTFSDPYAETIRVRYNPQAIARRPYLKELRAYKRRLRVDFDDHIFHSLYCLFHPEQWPSDHPHYKTVKAEDPDYTKGWGAKWKSLCNYDVDDHLKLKALTWKLWKEKYWRRPDFTGDWAAKYTKLKDILNAAWENLHAVEDHHKAIVERSEQSLKIDYREYLVSRLFNRKSAATCPPEFESEAEFIACNRKGTTESAMKQVALCKWIRAESRATGFKPPKRPVKPMTDLQKVRAAKKKKKAAAARRKQKRKEKQHEQ